MHRRNYPLLLAAQFLSAFGDTVILAVILGQYTLLFRNGVINEAQLGIQNAIITCLLFVPYVLLAPLAGYLNDRYSKTRCLLVGNAAKLSGTVVALTSTFGGTFLQPAGYFIVGIGACIYGPAKYGILPEILPREDLVKANGTVEILTLLAILIGPVVGAVMIDRWPASFCFLVLIGIFGLSLLLNVLMAASPAHPTVQLRTSVGEFLRHCKDLMASPRIFRILLGTGIFWFAGAVMKMNFQPWGLGRLKMENNQQVALLGLWLGLGITAGSVLSGRLYRTGELHHTRRYGILLAAGIAVLSVIAPNKLLPLLLVFVGLVAGLFLIPLNAALQAETAPSKLGKTIATQNLIDNIAMLAAGGFVAFLIRVLAAGPHQIWIGLSILVVIAVLFLGRMRNEQKV
jgi:LPLT family lysophospholipid transporter-like MFS transporter